MIEVESLLKQVTEADRAWLGVATALALYGGKKLIDALLPRGASFRFLERFFQNNRKDKD